MEMTPPFAILGSVEYVFPTPLRLKPRASMVTSLKPRADLHPPGARPQDRSWSISRMIGRRRR